MVKIIFKLCVCLLNWSGGSIEWWGGIAAEFVPNGFAGMRGVVSKVESSSVAF
jgi:hypothetical protein